MKTAAEIVARARGEQEAGRTWKAKDILRGRIGSGPLDSEVYDPYGLLLERMGDRFEAGKYLFLSGTRSPERAAAIEHFLTRQKGRHGADIIVLAIFLVSLGLGVARLMSLTWEWLT